MERKKVKIELPILEVEVLNLCLFPETFESILSECTVEKKSSIVADAIKNLLHLKLLVPTTDLNSLSWVYDSDRWARVALELRLKG